MRFVRYCLCLLFLFSQPLVAMEGDQNGNEAVHADSMQIESAEQEGPFAQLPDDLIVLIACALNKVIGSTTFINEADLQVIIKHIKAFSFVNKRFYAVLNDLDGMVGIIAALRIRFNLPDITVPAKLKMPGTDVWFQNYVERSGDYAQFKIARRLRALAYQVRNAQDGTECADEQKKCEFDHIWNCTRQGFFFSVESAPDALMTPWGEMELLKRPSTSWLKNLALAKAYMKLVKARLVLVPKLENETLYLAADNIDSLDKSTNLVDDEGRVNGVVLKEISYDEAVRFYGTDALVVSRTCGSSSLYKITELDGQPLQDAEFLPRAEYRDSEVLEKICDVMERRYRKELGLEPEAQKTNSTGVKRPREEMEKSVGSIPISSTDDVPGLYAKLFAALREQPLFDGQESGFDIQRLLPLDDSLVGDICNIISNAIYSQLSCDCPLHNYGKGNNQRYDAYGDFIPCGVELWRDVPELDQQKVLMLAQEIIKRFKDGWKAARLQDYPTIAYKESEEEWALFVKDCPFPEEALLIIRVAAKCNVRQYICCDNKWLDKNGRSENRKTMYLWVKKKHLQRFNDVFHFFDPA